MVVRVFRALKRVVIGVAAAAGVAVAVVALRLMAGPVDLEFLKAYLVQEFDTPAGKVRVSADRVLAEWGGISQPMRLMLQGLRIADSSERAIATAPSVALSFEPRSVVLGNFHPRSIVIERPTLTAAFDRQGGMLRRVFGARDSGTEGEAVGLLVDQLLAEPNDKSLLGRLDVVQVEQARLTVRDIRSGVSWVAPAARASFRRDVNGVAVVAEARLSDGIESVDVALSSIYARDRSRVSAVVKIDGLRPAMLAGLSSDVALLKGIDIALSGRLDVEADGNGSIRSVEIDVAGSGGALSLPGILPVPHRVQSVSARASVDATAHTAVVRNVDVDFGTVKMSIVGNGERTEQGQVFTGRAELKGVSVDRLGDYWPLEFAVGGRQWATANLSGGTVDIAAEFGFATPGDDLSQLSVTRNVAFLDYRGMTVLYMPQMPELQGVSGNARFEGDTMRFDVASGSAVGLKVAAATIELTGLDRPTPQIASLRIPISGPAPAVMALLAQPKLGLPREALYDPKRLAGDVSVDLSLSFPLLNTLAVADVEVGATAALSNFSMKGAIGTVDLTEAVGRVVYGNSQLEVTGQGKLDGNPAEILWREMFAARAPVRQRYEVKGAFPTAVVAKAGFPSPEPFVSGTVGTAIAYQVLANGTGELTAKLDLKGAKASIVPLGWTKTAGSDGGLSLVVRLARGGKLAAVDFDGQAPGLSAKGQARFVGDSALEQVSLQHIAMGRSNLAVDWKRTATGMDIDLKGRALEWSRVRQILRDREDTAGNRPANAASPSTTRVAVQIDQVLVERGTLGGLKGRIEIADERIAMAEIALGGGDGSAFRVTPAAAASGPGRAVAVYIPNLGALLGQAGWLDGYTGSFLDFTGRFDDAKPESPLEGVLKLGPYRLEQVTPRKDVGSMNSTIEGLNRVGNAEQQFNGLDANIVKTGDRIDIRNGRTNGPSIGLTASGTLDLGTETARLRGVVVPGFTLNNLLSNVPLIGPLLTGGKDGGLFAISYRLDGPLDDLKTDINVMSALTPGALREVFTAPADGSRTPDTTQPTGQERAP